MTRPEDRNLAWENYSGLNRAFYGSEPHTYFRHRISNVVLVGGRDAELRQLLDEGVKFGLLEMSRSEDAPERNEAEDQESAERFVALEAEVLLHHTAETLMRLVLAHRGPPPCPWLELARLRSFVEFKKELNEVFVDGSSEDRYEMIGVIFFGGTDRTELEPTPPEDLWDSSFRSIDKFLVRYASGLLSDAHLYNAAKHGLAVQPGEYGVRLETEIPIAREGMALQYLEVKDGEWHRTVDWVIPELSLVYALTATDLMEQLWSVARGRYLGENDLDLRLFSEEIHKVLRDAETKSDDRNPFVLRSMSQKLLYYNVPEST